MKINGKAVLISVETATLVLDIARAAADDFATVREREELQVGEDPEFDRGEASYLAALARGYYLNGKRAVALSTIARCLRLDPDKRYLQLEKLFRERG